MRKPEHFFGTTWRRIGADRTGTSSAYAVGLRWHSFTEPPASRIKLRLRFSGMIAQVGPFVFWGQSTMEAGGRSSLSLTPLSLRPTERLSESSFHPTPNSAVE